MIAKNLCENSRSSRSHIFKEANGVAKEAVELEETFLVMRNHPHDIWKLIYSDRIEKSTTRLIRDYVNNRM